MSHSRDRASSYTGPPFLKCATVSRAGPPSRGEPGDGGRVTSPFVYLRCLEHVGGVEDDAEGEGRSDEREHVPTPTLSWLRSRL